MILLDRNAKSLAFLCDDVCTQIHARVADIDFAWALREGANQAVRLAAEGALGFNQPLVFGTWVPSCLMASFSHERILLLLA